MPNPLPIEITKTGPGEITIRWDDGHTSIYSIHYLRSECACARCVNEITGMRILDPRTIAEDLTVLKAEHVGRYGIKFTFSDTHDDGIYTWERLRSLDKSLQSDARESRE
jgi:ATP-binding protein involved in chromosome partitioning